MALHWPDKDPDDILDYAVSWAARLAGDTIVSSTWIVPDGITKDSDSKTDTVTTIWLSGGSVGTKYTLVNRITTAAGRQIDQSVAVSVRTA